MCSSVLAMGPSVSLISTMWHQRVRLIIPLIIAMFVLAFGLSVAFAASSQVSRSVPGSITINLVTIEESADINRDGKIDQQDLLAITRKLDTIAAFGAREDINHDGVVDVLDLALVARFFGLEV